MSVLKRIKWDTRIEKGMEEAEKELRLWIERKDIKVIKWQIIPFLFPLRDSDGFCWKFGVELFIEYEEK